MKIKVQIYKCYWGWCAKFHGDQKKLSKIVDKVVKVIKKELPFASVRIEVELFGFEVSDDDLRKGYLGYTDSFELKTETKTEFINAIKEILDKHGIKYEIIEWI